MSKLSEQLRDAIEQSRASRYKIAKATGVSQSTLSKFVLGTRPGLSFDAMDRVAEYLGLVLVKNRKRRRQERGNARH